MGDERGSALVLEDALEAEPAPATIPVVIVSATAPPGNAGRRTFLRRRRGDLDARTLNARPGAA